MSPACCRRHSSRPRCRCRSSGTKSPMDEQGSTCLSIIQLSAPTSGRLASPPSARARLLMPSTSSDAFASAAAGCACLDAPERARANVRRRRLVLPDASAFPPASGARARRRTHRRSPGRTSCRGVRAGSRSRPRSSCASGTGGPTSSASKQSTTDRMRAPTGMSVPRIPSG